MLLDLIYMSGTLYIIYYLFNRIMNIGTRQWRRRGFELISSSYSFWERISENKNLEEVDQDFYVQIKKKKLQFGLVFELRQASLIIASPELLKKIMIKDFEAFVNRRQFKVEKTDPILNKMLLNLTGQEWRDMRSLLSPTFTTGKIRRMFNWFNSCSKEVEIFINNEISNGKRTVDTKEILGRCAMDIIASAAFGINCDSIKNEKDIFYLNGKKIQEVTLKRMLVVFCSFIAPKILEIFQVSFFNRKSTDFFINALRNALKNRENSKEKRNDFMQLMVNAKENRLENTIDETGAFEKDAELKNKGKSVLKITDELIIAQAFIFMFAGFDSTESLMVFMLYELAVNPEIQEKLAKEIKLSYDAEGGQFTYDSVNKMEYLDRVFSETLRKHPPAFRTERKSSLDYRFSDTNIVLPKETLIVIPIYAIHHDPEFYPNPELFDPDRFLPGEIAKRHPYSYLPFGHGPRNCIGMRFALMEAKTVIANLVLNFIIQPREKTDIPIKHTIKSGSTKPKGGLFLNYTKRQFD